MKTSIIYCHTTESKKEQSQICREILKSQIGDYELSYGPKGKPYIEGRDIKFNFSHSKNMVALIISDYPCGIDIEYVRDVNLDIAKKYFDRECKDRDDFFKTWVKYESYVKALGCGISKPFPKINEGKFGNISLNGYELSYCILTDEEIEVEIKEYRF